MASVTGRIISCGAGKNEMAILAILTRGIAEWGKGLTQRREGAKKTLVGFPYCAFAALREILIARDAAI